MTFFLHALPGSQTPNGKPLLGLYFDVQHTEPLAWVRVVEPDVVLELTKRPIRRSASMEQVREALAWAQSVFFHPRRDPIAYFDRVTAMAARDDRAVTPSELSIEGPHMLADGTWVCPGCQHFCEEPVGEDLCMHPDTRPRPGLVHGQVKPFTCPYFPEPIPRCPNC